MRTVKTTQTVSKDKCACIQQFASVPILLCLFTFLLSNSVAIFASCNL